MRNFNRIIFSSILLMVLLVLSANIGLYILSDREEIGREYRVEINRLANQILEEGMESIDISACRYVTLIVPYTGDGTAFTESKSDYVIKEIGQRYYRFEYRSSTGHIFKSVMIFVNIVMAIVFAVIMGVMIYIKYKIIKPFYVLRELPYELSKGNLTAPVKENKNKFFGKFVWGMDLLRENLEQQKKRELEIQREKKTLVLSMSHDVKTPLSAINLYAKALSKGLYKEEQKKKQIADNICLKVDEIEKYISEIVKAQNEDFLELPVCKGEFYLSQVLNKVQEFYSDKLEYIKIDFRIEPYADCIINGDAERSIEVIQNIMENAIKYGDGRTIALHVDYEEDNCLLTVRNSGNSLSETEIPHIFESFWRGSNAEGIGGSGLGLYICRELMLKMNGEIFAEITQGDMSITVVFELA